MSTSTDGGLTWGPAKNTADQAGGLGGQPLVLPNGTVVVPIDGFGGMIAFRSTDGGKSWSSSTLIANQNYRGEDGGLRDGFGMPTAQIDGSGKIYMVWPDCSFRSGCSTDDLVLTTSTNGTTWTKIARIPIDPITSTVDHFIPGIGVDRATSGKTAHLAVTYYYYPVASCNNSCQLYVGFTTSQNGRQDVDTREKIGWSDAVELATPIAKRIDGCRLSRGRLLERKPFWGICSGQGSQRRRAQRGHVHDKESSAGCGRTTIQRKRRKACA